MKNLILLKAKVFVMALSITSVANALDISPDRGLVIKAGETITLDANSSNVENVRISFLKSYKHAAGNVYILLKSLEMHKNSKIVVGSDIKNLIIEVSNWSTFFEGSKIVSKGLRAVGPGGDGGDGANIVLKVGVTYMQNFTVESNGANGASGAPGKDGKRAQRKKCSGSDGRRGTKGGDGTNGGDGGDGGDITFYIDNPSRSTSYSTVSMPGKKGYGGQAGKGGAGAPGKKCDLLFSRGSVKGGPNGNPGKNGEKGKPGQISVAWLK